jgi:hypothetical protein
MNLPSCLHAYVANTACPHPLSFFLPHLPTSSPLLLPFVPASVSLYLTSRPPLSSPSPLLSLFPLHPSPTRPSPPSLSSTPHRSAWPRSPPRIRPMHARPASRRDCRHSPRSRRSTCDATQQISVGGRWWCGCCVDAVCRMMRRRMMRMRMRMRVFHDADANARMDRHRIRDTFSKAGIPRMRARVGILVALLSIFLSFCFRLFGVCFGSRSLS